ncbi:hypothetical protein CVU82_03675 [Candidatus Falkowbacteria bacterium HGW-Falkowbacteria-1]|uniref:Septum formation initiator n=1 Tax=Candidatus Falkowbacteria bacterium HGW-Falkowbacteria-1 TaxID=2013768 RepID=A0A2N2E8W5_9BACT|nr:MAG: hypothetical protein CVU82_03675 [Candidatus Falkowbacteria bacterium HGW-Falkowbacteria-1]
MSKKYNLSPTERLNYVQKGKVSPDAKVKIVKKFFLSFFLLLILVLVLIPYFGKYKKQKALEEEILNAQADILKYEQRGEELKTLVSYLDSEQAAEERARVNFGLQKEGETVVVIKRSVDGEEEASTQREVLEQEEVSCFVKWFKYFFK